MFLSEKSFVHLSVICVKQFVMFLSEKEAYLGVICVKHFVMFLSEKSLSI
jgi:hypothetical protein